MTHVHVLYGGRGAGKTFRAMKLVEATIRSVPAARVIVAGRTMSVAHTMLADHGMTRGRLPNNAAVFPAAPGGFKVVQRLGDREIRSYSGFERLQGIRAHLILLDECIRDYLHARQQIDVLLAKDGKVLATTSDPLEVDAIEAAVPPEDLTLEQMFAGTARPMQRVTVP